MFPVSLVVSCQDRTIQNSNRLTLLSRIYFCSTMFKLLVVLVSVLSVLARKNELVLVGDEKLGQTIKTPVKVTPASELPASLDYRTRGLLTSDLNQHIPVYWYVKCFKVSVLPVCS